MIEADADDDQPDDLTGLNKWDLFGVSNKEGLGVSVQTVGWACRTLEDVRNAIRRARSRRSPSGAAAQAAAPPRPATGAVGDDSPDGCHADVADVDIMPRPPTLAQKPWSLCP